MHNLNRSGIASIRAAMKVFQFIVAEVDRDLRYVWIDNPHPSFDAASVVGKRDDELISKEEAKGIMTLKQDVLRSAKSVRQILCFHDAGGSRFYCISAFPLQNAAGQVDGIFTVGFETPAVLHGLIPICAGCKMLRDERGNWQPLEYYIEKRSAAQFTHSICPNCMKKLYPQLPKLE